MYVANALLRNIWKDWACKILNASMPNVFVAGPNPIFRLQDTH